MEVRIRHATIEDAAAICHLHKASVRGLCGDHYTPQQIDAWVGPGTPEDTVHSMEGGQPYLVAEWNREILGFASLLEDVIHAVYVHPSYARRGVGKALLQALEELAAQNSVKKLRLSSSLTAEPLYQANGYVSISKTVHTLRTGIEIPCVNMEKNLG